MTIGAKESPSDHLMPPNGGRTRPATARRSRLHRVTAQPSGGGDTAGGPVRRRDRGVWPAQVHSAHRWGRHTHWHAPPQLAACSIRFRLRHDVQRRPDGPQASPQASGPSAPLRAVQHGSPADTPPVTLPTVPCAHSRLCDATGRARLGYWDETRQDRDVNGVLWSRVSQSIGDDGLPAGEPKWRLVHRARQRETMLHLRCQVCGANARTSE